ncbi:MAG: hypothetical protein EOM26_11900 [Alphaproteobacteria bacterium]|nr:hypothetical protein [Alphaproteobacteria bacterium]
MSSDDLSFHLPSTMDDVRHGIPNPRHVGELQTLINEKLTSRFGNASYRVEVSLDDARNRGLSEPIYQARFDTTQDQWDAMTEGSWDFNVAAGIETKLQHALGGNATPYRVHIVSGTSAPPPAPLPPGS